MFEIYYKSHTYTYVFTLLQQTTPGAWTTHQSKHKTRPLSPVLKYWDYFDLGYWDAFIIQMKLFQCRQQKSSQKVKERSFSGAIMWNNKNISFQRLFEFRTVQQM